MTLLKLRLCGFKHIKLKVNQQGVLAFARLARNVIGRNGVLRIDANMAWTPSEAVAHIRALRDAEIRCFEQPVSATDLAGMAMLVRESTAEIFADESFSTRESMQRLLQNRACTGVNVRISKCGGLIAAARRCEEAIRAGLGVQIGCQVGESSLLSAAQLILISSVQEPRYVEGCYGEHLLRTDPVRPCLQIGYGGRPPRLPGGVGLGVEVDETVLNRFVTKRVVIEGRGTTRKEPSHFTRRQTDPVPDRVDDSQGVRGTMPSSA